MAESYDDVASNLLEGGNLGNRRKYPVRIKRHEEEGKKEEDKAKRSEISIN